LAAKDAKKREGTHLSIFIAFLRTLYALGVFAVERFLKDFS